MSNFLKISPNILTACDLDKLSTSDLTKIKKSLPTFGHFFILSAIVLFQKWRFTELWIVPDFITIANLFILRPFGVVFTKKQPEEIPPSLLNFLPFKGSLNFFGYIKRKFGNM